MNEGALNPSPPQLQSSQSHFSITTVIHEPSPPQPQSWELRLVTGFCLIKEGSTGMRRSVSLAAFGCLGYYCL
jgi:hypothetical protein